MLKNLHSTSRFRNTAIATFAIMVSVPFSLLAQDNLADAGCDAGSGHISCFTSVMPGPQMENLILPKTHGFQVIFEEGQAYTIVNGGQSVAKGNNDFTAFIGAKNQTSSTKGYLSINHETDPGGVSIVDIEYNERKEKWEVNKSQSVLFLHPALGIKSYAGNYNSTIRNCSGGITPWGTVITSEESTVATDTTSDGYAAIGWHVEIDPITAKIKEYGNKKPEKLWSMGRMNHENIVVAKDSLTAYFGDDVSNGNIFKFVADAKMNLSKGKLYVLKLDSGLVASEPTSQKGIWVLVPNTTVQERNAVKTSAVNLQATIFRGIEDVEISPVDGDIYFTAKTESRTYRFKDNGNTVSNFKTFVGGKSYAINYGDGLTIEPWGTGNDNLTFDDQGNLYVLQDGSNNHIWFVHHDHTQADPKVEMILRTPAGSEPTGMTFSPDFKFMFLSIQTPDVTNTVPTYDAQGNPYVFNKSTTIVVARKEYLDGGHITAITDMEEAKSVSVFPNPADKNFSIAIRMPFAGEAAITMTNVTGQIIKSVSYNLGEGAQMISLNHEESGIYFLKISVNGIAHVEKLVIK